MRRRLRSSTARLGLLYLLGGVLGVGALLWTVFLLTERAMDRQVDLVIETEAESLREEYKGGGLQRLVDVLDQRTDDWGRLGAVYILLDPQGMPLAGNLSAWPGQLTPEGNWRRFQINAVERGREVMHLVRAAVVELDGNRLLVGTDLSDRLRFTARLRATTLWGIASTVALMALIGWWFSRGVAGRVRGVAQACASIISGDLARRLPVAEGYDEFDQLAAAVNDMLDRIEHQTQAVRTTFDSAAHDLRAPMYRIRSRLEAALTELAPEAPAHVAMQATIVDLERVQRTLAMLLQIAQAEAGGGNGGGARTERVDLAQMARELGELYAPEARERGLLLQVNAQLPAVVSGHQQLLAQLCTNLLENAIKYVPAGGHVEVHVYSDGGRVQLSVSDDGPGIPPEARAAMVLPFRRLGRDAAAPGSGLGLSLVAAVVRLHHGQLELENASGESGNGLRVRCSFTEAPEATGRA
jgi:signal transduction histidine kinase